MPDLILSYAPPQRKKPFRYHTLVIAIASIIAVITFDFVYGALDDTYFGPPRWLNSLGRWILIPTLLAPLASLVTLCMLPFHQFTYRQLGVVLVLAPSCFFLPTVLPCHPMEWRHDFPFERLMANACCLAQSSCVYAADHADHFPPHPAVLLLDNYMSSKQLADFDDTPYVLPAPTPPESAWPTIAPALDARSLFIYTAADLTTPPSPLDSKIIIAYTKPSRVLPNHHILAFADGHAELARDSELPTYFTNSNTARATLHLPPTSTP
ncbi:MAG TPA: hypothetical protein VM008_21240 [Phycisphaerae bacterium]|nr:hypothetical protein [Phycisphaerae bacterium]